MYENHISFDTTLPKERLGERHPILQIVGKAIIGGMVFTFITLSLCLLITSLEVKKVEASKVFQPVHLSTYLKTH